MAATINAICIKVATLDKSAPATAGPRAHRCVLTRVAMAPTVATLEAKPLNNPAKGKPRRSPSHRAAKWPTLPVTMISSTSSQSV